MTSSPMTMWVTRSSPFNLLTAKRLRAMGHAVVASPLFDIRPTDAVDLPWAPELIVFTSINGVRHHPFDAHWADVPVFAVGDTTAAAARRCGYRNVMSADGNVRDLQRLILASAVPGKKLIHFSAGSPAGDLVAYLRARGFDAVRQHVYDAQLRPLDQVRAMLSAGPRIDGIVVHSPAGGRRAADLIADSGWSGSVFCISAACAKEFHGISRISVESAARPTERALMQLIRDASAIRDEDRLALRLRGLAVLTGTTARDLPESANDNPSALPARI